MHRHSLTQPKNNLDALRLIAAMLVLVGHSFVFLGVHEPLFLSMVPLGVLGVYIFFIISGYLVSASWENDPHPGRFFKRRLLRIIPGLAVCVILCVFVLGPLVTRLPLADYFRERATYSYLRNIALYLVYPLPGVFESSRVGAAVNGSMWSLPVEFTMYILLAAVGVLLRGNRWALLAVAVASGILAMWWAWPRTSPSSFYHFDLRQVPACGTYFWAGAVFHKFGLRRHLSMPLALLAMAALLAVESSPFVAGSLSWILLPVPVLSFGLAANAWLARFTSTGDYSYGVYIYAFPVQQAVLHFWPGIGWWPNLGAVTLSTLALAVASWHLVEQRALRLKPASA